MDKTKVITTAKKSYQFYQKNKGTIQKIAASEVFHPAAVRNVEHRDRELLPLIRKAHPGFSLNEAKAAVKKALEEKYGGLKGYSLHEIALSDYLAGSTLVFQAVFQNKHGLVTAQRRVIAHYTCFENNIWQFTQLRED